MASSTQQSTAHATQLPVTYVSPPETAFDRAGTPRCHLRSSFTAAVPTITISHPHTAAAADYGPASPKPFLPHAWPAQQSDGSPDPDQGQDLGSQDRNPDPDQGQTLGPQDRNPDPDQGQVLSPQDRPFQGTRVLQELAKLRASEQPDWEEEEGRPGLGVGSSMSIARRRQSMDNNQASIRCSLPRQSDILHIPSPPPCASPCTTPRHHPHPHSPPQPQPQPQHNNPSLKTALAAIAASSAAAMAAAAAAAALPAHTRRRSVLTALFLSLDSDCSPCPSPGPSPSAHSYSCPPQRSAPSPRALNRPSTCLYRSTPGGHSPSSTSQVPDPGLQRENSTGTLPDSPPWPSSKPRRSSLDLPAGPRPLHLAQLNAAYCSQPCGPADSPRSPGQGAESPVGPRGPRSVVGGGGRAATALGSGSARRASAAIADEGQALIRQLNELDCLYGVRQDGTTVATMTIRQHELHTLHGVGAGAAHAHAPPTPEWELPLCRRPPAASPPASGGVRAARSGRNSQAGLSEHSEQHSTRSSCAGYGQPTTGAYGQPTSGGFGQPTTGAYGQPTSAGQVGRGSFTGQGGHSSLRSSHTGHTCAPPGGGSQPPAAAAAAAAAGSSSSSVVRRDDAGPNSRVVDKISEKLTRLFTWKHQQHPV